MKKRWGIISGLRKYNSLNEWCHWGDGVGKTQSGYDIYSSKRKAIEIAKARTARYDSYIYEAKELPKDIL